MFSKTKRWPFIPICQILSPSTKNGLSIARHPQKAQDHKILVETQAKLHRTKFGETNMEELYSALFVAMQQVVHEGF